MQCACKSIIVLRYLKKNECQKKTTQFFHWNIRTMRAGHSAMPSAGRGWFSPLAICRAKSEPNPCKCPASHRHLNLARVPKGPGARIFSFPVACDVSNTARVMQWKKQQPGAVLARFGRGMA